MRIEGKQSKLIYPDLSYKINGVLFSTHNELGRYCNEQQYGDAVQQKLKDLTIAYQREFEIPISFKGEEKNRNKTDFLVDDKIILELKVKRVLGREEYYQVRRYLKSAKKKLGILVNFRDRYLNIRRIINSEI